jgi:hypothetical protein
MNVASPRLPAATIWNQDGTGHQPAPDMGVECPFRYTADAISARDVAQYRLWALGRHESLPWGMATSESGASIPGLAAGVGAVWRHQHPVDCARADFLIQLPYEKPCGTGCMIHQDSDALILAMKLGRVLIQAYVVE